MLAAQMSTKQEFVATDDFETLNFLKELRQEIID